MKIDPRYLDCAFEMAAASAAVIKKHFRTALDVQAKADESPVTIADRQAELVMREIAAGRFPEHGFVGEEFGRTNADAEFVWVVDPIDGTKSFIAGSLDFGTIIALLRNGEPVLGIVNHPIAGEIMAGDNIECTLNGVRVSMRSCSSISEATLLACDFFNVGQFQQEAGFRALLQKVKTARTWGNCFGYTLLARGTADIMIDPIMSPWDIMGVVPIIRGAGGIISDYQGGDPVRGTSIVAAHPQIHEAVITALNQIQPA